MFNQTNGDLSVTPRDTTLDELYLNGAVWVVNMGDFKFQVSLLSSVSRSLSH